MNSLLNMMIFRFVLYALVINNSYELVMLEKNQISKL